VAARPEQIAGSALREIRATTRLLPAILLFLPFASMAQDFTVSRTVDQGIEVVHLKDVKRDIEVAIVPSVGNRAVGFKVHGKDILFFPYSDMASFQKKPELNGIPFLAPWANRLDGPSFWSDGKKFILNPTLGNYSTDRNGLPIHGLLTASPLWSVESLNADAESAQITSKLEFWKYPELMAQWPFAQEYEMTYRLANGALEVKLTISNLGSEPMPVAVGFHPYYRIPDKPRDQWIARLPVRKSVLTDQRLIPTGELEPLDLPNPLPLNGHLLDNGYTDMQRDADGRAHFFLESGEESIELMFGPKYPVSIIWEPRPLGGRPGEFICFEPMTGVTNAVNLHHAGKYPDLQVLPAAAKWTESFWIKPSGF
jgi:aldose 1-epimerase